MKKMKVLFGLFVLAMLVTTTFVSAGSIEDLDYKDRAGWRDYNREINDNNVDIDADTLEGNDLDDLESMMDDKVDDLNDDIKSGDKKVLKKAINKMDNKDDKVKDYSDINDRRVISSIMSYDAKWSADSSGTSFSHVEEYLYDDYSSYTKEMCRVDEYEQRISELESQLDNLYAIVLEVSLEDYQQARALEMARETGLTARFRSFTCDVFGLCLQNVE